MRGVTDDEWELVQDTVEGEGSTDAVYLELGRIGVLRERDDVYTRDTYSKQDKRRVRIYVHVEKCLKI